MRPNPLMLARGNRLSMRSSADLGQDAKPSEAIRALLFDLGNVIWRIDNDPACQHWSRCTGIPPDELLPRFRADEAFEQHERGEITDEEYYEHFVATTGIRVAYPDFVAGWQSILREEIPGVGALLRLMSAQIPLYALSNTNGMHRHAWPGRYGHVLSLFRKVFCSHEIGMRKPEPRAYLHVCDEVGVDPSRVLFFDDSPVNVQAARSVGMSAERVVSCAEIASALRAHGFEVGGGC